MVAGSRLPSHQRNVEKGLCRFLGALFYIKGGRGVVGRVGMCQIWNGNIFREMKKNGKRIRTCVLLACVAVRCSVCVAVCCSVRCNMCCSVLQCVVPCCTVLHCVALRCSVLQRAAVCCSVLQCAEMCCSVLQCAAVCRDEGYLFHGVLWNHRIAVCFCCATGCCNVLQCVVVCCTCVSFVVYMCCTCVVFVLIETSIVSRYQTQGMLEVIIHHNTLYHMVTHFSSLQLTATHCNALQYTAPRHNKLLHTVTHISSTSKFPA